MSACCFLSGKIVLVENPMHICLEIGRSLFFQDGRCLGKAANCQDGQAAAAVYCLDQEKHGGRTKEHN